MDDLISKQNLIKAVNTWPKFGCDERGKLVPWNENYVPYIHLTDAITAINGMPSAEPQVIHCKDCKFYEHDVGNEEYGVCCNPQWVVGNVGCGVSAIDFCSYAERMEVEHEC